MYLLTIIEPDQSVSVPPASETALYLGIVRDSDNIPQYTDEPSFYNGELYLHMYSHDIRDAITGVTNNTIVWINYSYYLNNTEAQIYDLWSNGGLYPAGEPAAWIEWQEPLPIMYPYTSSDFYLRSIEPTNSFDLNFLFAKVTPSTPGIIQGNIIQTDKNWNIEPVTGNKFIPNDIKIYDGPSGAPQKPSSGNAGDTIGTDQNGIYFNLEFPNWIGNEPEINYNYGIPLNTTQYLRPVVSTKYENDLSVQTALNDNEINVNFEPQFTPGPQKFQQDMLAFLIKNSI
jgi:hypothetical protein